MSERVRCLPLAVLLACGGGGGDDDPDAGAAADARVADAAGGVTVTVGAAGGTVEGGGVVITIPAGALDADTEITLEVDVTPAAALPASLVALTPAIRATPHGLTFAAAVTVELPLTGSPGAGAAGAHYLADDEDTTWELLGAATLTGDTLSFATTHFSTMGGTGTVEDCDDQVDNDGDGLDGCADPDCCVDSECTSAPACIAAGEDCDNGVDDADDDILVDCADPDCDAQCGDITVPWTVTLDGDAVTCQMVAGDIVELGFDGPAQDYVASAVCSAGTHTQRVPAGTYTIDLELRDVTTAPIATAGPVMVTVAGGGNASAASQTFALVNDGCAPIVINRVYKSGGTSASGWDYDFVELHNRTAAGISLTGWSLQIMPGNGSPWDVVSLTGETIPASGFLLVALGRGVSDTTDGMDLTPDVVGPTTLNLTSGYAIMLRDVAAAAADGACPTANRIDLFGEGGNTCVEAQGFLGGVGPTSAIERADTCTDTDVNSADFASNTIATPRNSATTPVTCPAC